MLRYLNLYNIRKQKNAKGRVPHDNPRKNSQDFLFKLHFGLCWDAMQIVIVTKLKLFASITGLTTRMRASEMKKRSKHIVGSDIDA